VGIGKRKFQARRECRGNVWTRKKEVTEGRPGKKAGKGHYEFYHRCDEVQKRDKKKEP